MKVQSTALEDEVFGILLYRLVHRLDKMTTGALILARDSNAASWLCQAFHDQQSKNPVPESQRLCIEKTYWAILDARAMALRKGKIQTLFTEGATKQPTETYFETLALKQDLAFVKLKPKTGTELLKIVTGFGSCMTCRSQTSTSIALCF